MGRNFWRVAAVPVAAFLTFYHLNAAAQDLQFYKVVKGQEFIQTGPGLPEVFLRNTPFEFEAELKPDNDAEVHGVFLRKPNGVFIPLPQQNENFRLGQAFGTDLALDTVFPSGQYAFLYRNGPAVTINLPQDAYPPAPHIANWAALQGADPTSDLTIAWTPFTGAAENDFIEVRLRAPSGGDVFRTPELDDDSSPLPASENSVTVPAGRLRPNLIYTGRIRFHNVTQLIVNPDGSVGVSGFYRETQFFVRTSVAPPPQGRVQFGSAVRTVTENGGAITLPIHRTGGSSGYTEVTVTTVPVSAQAGVDYGGPTTQVVAFGNAVTEQTVTIPIINDSLFEGTEQFRVRLTSPIGGLVLGNVSTTTVNILDDERIGAGIIQFTAANYAVREGIARALITVARSGTAALPASVQFRARGGTATENADFTPVERTITFLRGERVKVVSIPIINDPSPEGIETILCELSNPSAGAVLGARREATLRILANDGIAP